MEELRHVLRELMRKKLLNMIGNNPHLSLLSLYSLISVRPSVISMSIAAVLVGAKHTDTPNGGRGEMKEKASNSSSTSQVRRRPLSRSRSLDGLVNARTDIQTPREEDNDWEFVD